MGTTATLVLTMLIYLVRHSRAIAGGPGITDEVRYLTEQGRMLARAVGRALGAASRPDRLLSSPLVRAVQTAELIAQEIGFAGEVQILASLSPGGAPEATARHLGTAASVALVGHEPTISDLGALLTSRPAFPPSRPAQVSLIEDGRPIWTLNPETLQREPLLLA
jgi:phosphohistidine phosphatase